MKCGTYKRSSRSIGSARKSTTKRTRVKQPKELQKKMSHLQYLEHLGALVRAEVRPLKARLRSNRN